MENAQQESMLVGGLFLSLLVTWGSTEISQLPHFQSSILLLSLVLFCFVCMLMARLSTTVLYVATRGRSIAAIFSGKYPTRVLLLFLFKACGSTGIFRSLSDSLSKDGEPLPFHEKAACGLVCERCQHYSTYT